MDSPLMVDEPKLAQRLTSSRTIGENALWNTLGRAVPMIVATIFTPRLIREFGVDRWGVFTIALSLIGVFGMFDFGVGRALTRNIAAAIGADEHLGMASRAKTSLVLLLIVGIIGSITMALLVRYWAQYSLKVPAPLVSETAASLYILCFALPLVILNAAMWGIISAFQLSRPATLWGTPLMMLYYIGPLIIFRTFHSLTAVITLLLVLRLAMTLLYGSLSSSAIPGLFSAPIRFATLRPVLRLSGWMTVSNLIWPMLNYLDRFVIASFVSAAATGYYSTSGDVINRLTFLPNSVTSTAFAAIATCQQSAPADLTRIIRRTILVIVSAILPISLVFILFGPALLTLWLGSSFASHSALIFRWFSIGLIFLAADTLVTAAIDAMGFPKLNARFSLIELMLFVPLLAISVRGFGLQGAAIVWSARVTIDLFVRLAMLCRLLPQLVAEIPAVLACVLGAGVLSAACFFPSSMSTKAVALVASLGIYFALLWTFALEAAERNRLEEYLLVISRFARAV